MNVYLVWSHDIVYSLPLVKIFMCQETAEKYVKEKNEELSSQRPDMRHCQTYYMEEREAE